MRDHHRVVEIPVTLRALTDPVLEINLIIAVSESLGCPRRQASSAHSNIAHASHTDGTADGVESQAVCASRIRLGALISASKELSARSSTVEQDLHVVIE